MTRGTTVRLLIDVRNLSTVLGVVLLILTSCVPAEPARQVTFEDDWPMFGGNPQRTSSNTDALPIAQGRVRWSYSTGSAIFSSPAVADGVVYVGTESGLLYALDAATGRRLWRFRLPGSIGATPAIADGVVYIGAGGHFYALDAKNGAVVWEQNLEKSKGGGFGDAVVVGGIVYVMEVVDSDEWGIRLECDLLALDAATGAILWWEHYQGGEYSAPAVSEDVVYVLGNTGTLHAVDSATRTELWRFHHTNDRLGEVPVLYNGVVYVGGDRGYLYAIDSQTGDRLWSWRVAEDGRASSPAVADGVVYVADTTLTMVTAFHLYAVDATTGTELWEAEVDGPFWLTPSVGGRTVYVSTEEGLLHAFDALSGEKLWELRIGRSSGSPAVVGDIVYVAGGSTLYAIDADGQVVTRPCGLAMVIGGGLVTLLMLVAGGVVWRARHSS